MSYPVISQFTVSPYGPFYGHPFTEDEIAAAGQWLKTEEYIAGKEVWGGGIPRPSITAKGERVIESGRSVNDDAPVTANAATSVTHVTVTGSGNNIAANSPGARQTATVTMTVDDRAQVVKLADAVDQDLPVLRLDAGRVAEAQAVSRELREVAAAEVPDRARLTSLIQTVQAIAIGAAAGAFGDGLFALAQFTAHALGIGG